MPVKKSSNKKGDCCGNSGLCHPSATSSSCWSNHFVQKMLVTLLGILLVYIIVWVATIIRNNLKTYEAIGEAEHLQRTINIEAEGAATARPDIAVTTIGMISEGKTVAESQQKNTEVMNKLTERLQAFGVESKDMRTVAYNIYPMYDYTEKEGRVLKGYEVNQQLEIKIRNLENASAVLNLAGEVGANSVSGLNFTIDDKEVYVAEARRKALERIKEKTLGLTQSLGVRVLGLASYSEFEVSPGNLDGRLYSMESGMGGGAAPEVSSGSMEIRMNVNVVLEIQ
ncbi:MAG: SIMPL domain-containing protein [Candidatus Magasanikbacteria bacterium]|nr:SIMPL domain-containing protein [Candidatus Magasanikbacteria bacterium]